MKNKLKAFLATLFFLAMHISAEGAADRVCNYTAGSTTTAQGFTNCTEEVAKLYQRAPIETTGAAGTDTYSASSSPAVTALSDGMSLWIEIPNTNTGASTLNLDGNGNVTIRDPAGSAMAAGDLVANTRYLMQYRSTGPQWRVMSPKGAGGTATGAAGGDLSGTYPNPTVAADAVALTTDTSGNYVGTVADGTGIDGTASGEGATFTPTLDLTELNSATLGAGAFTSLTFDAGAVDTIFGFSSNNLVIGGGGTAPLISIDDQGELRFREEDAGGDNYVSFAAPAAIGTNRTCVLVDGAAPIPDSCVGDGSDAGSAGGDDVTINGLGLTNPNLSDNSPAAAAGGFNVKWQNSSSDTSAYVDINGLTEDATADVDADFLATYDGSATASKKVRVRTLLKLLNALTEDATPDASNDFLLSYDASAGDVKKVKPSNLTSSSVPPGAITMYGAATAPSGWQLCDGSAISRTTYAALFGIIGTNYGAGDGSTTFNLPDLRSRIPVGYGTGTVTETQAAANFATSDIITVTSNTMRGEPKWVTGDVVQVTTTGSLPTGISAATDYYVIRLSATTISLATSLSNAMAGTAVNITATGSGNHTITNTLETRSLNEQFGTELNAGVPSHSHSLTSVADAAGAGAQAAGGSAARTSTVASTNAAGSTEGITAFPPAIVVNYIIKE